MQLNITTDYAIRIVKYLAIKLEVTTAKEISEAMGIPEKYIMKITRKLKDAGIINAYSGAKGGYSLKKQSNEITILDIVKVMENTIKINRCLEDDVDCSRMSKNTCLLHKYYRSIQSELESKLDKLTIENCIKEVVYYES
ncbi:MAG: Rrf2 family transcriptional regulator [Clostridium sp.]|nr:Rrf2 family transcriptional regulator [Clostridium sp.]